MSIYIEITPSNICGMKYSENCLKRNCMGPTKNLALSSFPLYSIKRKNSGLFNSNKYQRILFQIIVLNNIIH
jgi:hypothetical protein